jgi:hypothetical protein
MTAWAAKWTACCADPLPIDRGPRHGVGEPGGQRRVPPDGGLLPTVIVQP